VSETTVLAVAKERGRIIDARFAHALRVDGARDDSPSPAPRAGLPHVPMPAWVLGGLGALGIATFGTFEFAGHAALSDIRAGCGASHSCTNADVAAAKGDFVGAGVSLGVGAAALAAGVVWFLATRGENHAKVAGAAREREENGGRRAHARPPGTDAPTDAVLRK
jgi:hypothetical protein